LGEVGRGRLDVSWGGGVHVENPQTGGIPGEKSHLLIFGNQINLRRTHPQPS